MTLCRIKKTQFQCEAVGSLAITEIDCRKTERLDFLMILYSRILTTTNSIIEIEISYLFGEVVEKKLTCEDLRKDVTVVLKLSMNIEIL